MEKNFQRKGSCLAEWQKEANEDRDEGWIMDYELSKEGVLTISGNTLLSAIPTDSAIPYYEEPEGEPDGWSEYTSQFKDMDFHTVVIKPGVRILGEECFKDCKNFRKLILPEKVPVIRKSFADGTSLEYTIKDHLKFLGPPDNPLFYLMGCEEDYNPEILKIPEGTIMIVDEAFLGKKSIKEVLFPSSLEFLGWYTFNGTSIKTLVLPEGKLAYDETLIAFDGNPGAPLETISLPFSMYQKYKEGEENWLVATWNRTCTIIFRNPEDSVAEIIEPHPLKINLMESVAGDTSEETRNNDFNELPF